MASSPNQKVDAATIFFIIIFLLIGLFPILGVLLLIIGIVVFTKKAGNTNASGEKKTDYSGMSKAMLKGNAHEHTAGMHNTDFCGTDKNMVSNAPHQHGYDMHNTDFCGTDKNMVKKNTTPNRVNVINQNTAPNRVDAPKQNTTPNRVNTPNQNAKPNTTPNRSQMVNTKARKNKGSYYDGKTNEQIYNELVNRKTDYSGVDPNILRRG